MGNSKANNCFSSKLLERILFQEMALDTSAPFFVAYSGGMDSTILLHALSQLPLNITALHVDHGLQPSSEKWFQHCKKQCQQLSLPFFGTHLNVQRDKKIGLEASARNARYSWFRQMVPNNAYLLTAHHQRDQAETMLFNMLRGAGMSGISAMSKSRNINGIKLIRPLLDISYQALQEYAEQQQLNWVEDPSNAEMEFSRNRIRHAILPSLESFREDAVAMLSRTAANIADSKVVLDEILADDLGNIQQREFNPLDCSMSFDLCELTHFSKTRAKHILRYWLENKCGVMVSRKLLQQLCEWVYVHPKSTAILQESGQQYRCNVGVLYVMPELNEKPILKKYTWTNLDQEMVIPELSVRLIAKDRLRALTNISIVFRETGLLFTRNNKVVKLKGLMMQKKMPPWLRYRTPLIVSKTTQDKQFILHDIIENNENDFCHIEKIN